MLKAEVDRERCQGHARCEILAREVFEVDEEGYARVKLDVLPAELEPAARRAADNCPERCITISG